MYLCCVLFLFFVCFSSKEPGTATVPTSDSGILSQFKKLVTGPSIKKSTIVLYSLFFVLVKYIINYLLFDNQAVQIILFKV